MWVGEGAEKGKKKKFGRLSLNSARQNVSYLKVNLWLKSD